MITRNDILLEENQHRLLMCMRMAKSLGVGEVYLNLATHKPFWYIERNGVCHERFYSMEEMESYLEHLLENRWRPCGGLGTMSREVKRRYDILTQRRLSRTNGSPMLFPSSINRM